MQATNVSSHVQVQADINQQHDGQILLSRLVGEHINQNFVLNVQVQADITADILDDLEFAGVQSATIEFCLHENAQLSVRMRSMFGMKKLSTTGDDQHVIPAYKTDFAIDRAAGGPEDVSRKIIIRLVGAGAAADVRYACLGTDKKKFSFDVLQEHQAERATSNVSIRSVLEENANLRCKGMIHIQPGAQQTHAELENKNILLGASARAVSIPMLEIEANDVVCKHGAAVSKLDAEHFFYLQSRGIDVHTARTMLINSFLQ